MNHVCEECVYMCMCACIHIKGIPGNVKNIHLNKIETNLGSHPRPK